LRIGDAGHRQILRQDEERFDGSIEQFKFYTQGGLTALW